MFQGCTNLTTAPDLPATTLAKACYSGMFKECENLTITPALPATTLADYCYNGMFNGCIKLNTLPALSATTLTIHCYQSMFYNCSSIKMSSTKTGEYVNEYRIPYGTGTGATANYALGSMFSGTGGTFTGAPSINRIYYTSNDIIE